VLLVGAGEMIELAATHFAAKQPKHIAICNRSAERAQPLCAQFQAEYIPLPQLPERLPEFDAVITCTASTLPIIGLGAVERALKIRRHRPIFMVDLAVPRDIEPQVGKLDDVYLYTLDDLSRVVQTGQQQRQAAVAQAQRYIEAGLTDFSRWAQDRSQLPLIQNLQERSKLWQAQEIARVKKRLAQGEDLDQALAALANAISQKFLHGPMRALRSDDTEERLLAEQATSRWYVQDQTDKG
jgi:glutamyl-tRNA reductase